MSYPAIVYNVILSSPSDAANERRLLRECINRWNDSHSEHNEMVLLPLDCDNNVPSVSAGIEDPRGQAVVNERIVNPSDWLVVVFRNTFGIPTGREESGTIEEIKLFRQIKPLNPVSIYFYKMTEDEKVKEYKEEFFGYSKEYTDLDNLEKIFSSDISHIIFKDKCFQKKLVDSKARIEERTQVLLFAVAEDKQNLVFVSRLLNYELRIETNGCKYVGYEVAFERLCNRNHLERADEKGELFRLTDLGKKEVETLKNFSAF